MDTDAFDYDLPIDRIAQQPIHPREAARLLVDGGSATGSQHRYVSDLPGLLEPGDVVVVNDTRVIPARLHLRRSSGAAVELLLLEEIGPRQWQALARPSRRLRPGERLTVEVGETSMAGGGLDAPAVVLGQALGEGRWEVVFDAGPPVLDLLERFGEVPLPPYITARLEDPERYQTVFARRPGSVAAPTAGLHLSASVLAGLAERGIGLATVDLVVGLGSFRPITTAKVEDHLMHEEAYRIPEATIEALGRAKRVVAVGTTVVRTLESWAATGEAEGRSRLFIRHPYPFAVVDLLLTNFHVPRSSLLVLVDAFVGPRWRDLYTEALRHPYRFLSFGDAMLLTRS